MRVKNCLLDVHIEKAHFDPGPSAAEAALQACATMPERTIAEQDALKPGEAVRIYNLTGRPELNHRRGKVVSYAKAKGRYAVEVPGLPNVMLFKLANLQLVSVEDVAPLEPHNIVLPQQHLSPSRYTDNRAAPATAEDDAAGDSLDYDALLASVDFAMLRDHLLRAGSRPGCAPMPGRLLRQLPAHRSCLVGLIGILLRSRDGPATLVQQAADALSRICTFGAAGRSAVRRAGGAAALVHAVHNPPSAPQLAEDGDAEDESDAAGLPPAPPTTQPEVPSLPPGSLAPMTTSTGLTSNKAIGRTDSKFDPTLVPRAACHALTNLANGDMACKEAVAEAGGAAALVGTMKQFAQAEDDILAPIVCKLCVGGLANIAAGDSKCMRAVLKTNSVVEVVRALKTFGPEWPELAADCCLALTNFAAGKGEGAEAVVDAGGVPALIATLKAFSAKAPRVREWGAAALANLASAKSPEITETLIETPAAIKAAVAAVEHAAPDEGRTLHFGITVWSHLGSTPDGSEACVRSGFVDTTLRRLLDVTAGPASVRFVEESCRSFATLAFADAEGRATLREAGAIRVLTLVLERFPRDGGIQEMARALLTELTRDSRIRE